MNILGKVFGRRGNGGESQPPRVQAPDDLQMPAIWLARSEDVHALNRLGGLPSMPEVIAWPRQTATETPLHFLAQIDLATLPPTPLDARIENVRLPRAGLLFFFADIEEEMLWDFEDRGGARAATRVIYAPAPGPERQPPADIPEIGHAFGATAGGYAKGMKVYPAKPVVPYVIDIFVGAALYFQGDASRRADELTLASIERATGRPVPVIEHARPRAEVDQHPAAWLERRGKDGEPIRRVAHLKRHQMLGAATNVQGAANAARAADHVLLLQLDSDWGVHNSFTFCDMGMVQFWITPEDLAAGRFERAWATTEGG